MSLFGKLEKLLITSYGDVKRKSSKGTFEAQFNPESYSRRHTNTFQKNKGINVSGRSARFSHGETDELSLTLIIDGTHADIYGLTAILSPPDPVPDQVEDFLEKCYNIDGDLHEPRFLNIKWGKLDMNCRLRSVDINYTLFNKEGEPLRAELKTTFVEDLDPEADASDLQLSSPDVTHSRTVKAGDTLPLLVNEVYGDSASPTLYLHIARFNQLNHFRVLQPGQEILFPPLT